MEEHVDPKEIIFEDTKSFIENKHSWAKLKLKRDKKTGIGYMDIIAGEKNKKAHCHIGLGFNGKEIFREDRGKINEITRRVTSKLHGKLPDEKIVLNNLPESYRFRVSVELNGTAKKATLKKFEFVE